MIERGWLRLRLEWGDAIATIYKKGLDEGIYDDTDELHWYVVLSTISAHIALTSVVFSAPWFVGFGPRLSRSPLPIRRPR